MEPDEIVRKILEVRGIVSDEDVREFLSAKPKLAHDPLLLPGTEAGAEFLFGALSRGGRICVYGDYDVDGVCGTALLVLFLREASKALGGGSTVTYYIPSRIEEGYGLNNSAIRAIREAGADVIVTVDCGSVSVAEAAYAKGLGLGILITDHHDPDPGGLPDCALVNPKIGFGGGENKGYPFAKLSGAGVAFKLCGALRARIEAEIAHASETPLELHALRKTLQSLVDLVCVATIADVMPLVDENRTFVKYGLPLLRKGTRPAFRELFRVSDINAAKVDVREIAFGIAPRMNALGRLGAASDGVELFLTDDNDRIHSIAEHMNILNIERRRIQDDSFRDCMELYESGAVAGPFLLLKPARSHEGVAGIVAGKVREETGLPCAVLTGVQEGMGLLKGSARSGGRLDLIALLRRHGGLFERLGGHTAAAGFTIRAENEDALRAALSSDLASMLEKEPGLLDEHMGAELEITLSDAGPALAEAIGALAPFGFGNPKPSLALRIPASCISGIRHMGQDRKHIRFAALGIPFVFFGGADTMFPDSGDMLIIGCPEMNEWNGSRNFQFAVTCIDML